MKYAYLFLVSAFLFQQTSAMEGGKDDADTSDHGAIDLVFYANQATDLVFYENIDKDYQEALRNKQRLPAQLYSKVIENFIISCVDVVVYNPASETFFVVRRNQEPAQGLLWLPGGRQLIFESPFQCAVRKCAEEMGLSVLPIALLCSSPTIFGESAWNNPTHTNNQVVLAILDPSSGVHLDEHHEGAQWVPLATNPAYSDLFGDNVMNLYLQDAVEAARKAIREHAERIEQLTSSQEERDRYRASLEHGNRHQATKERYERKRREFRNQEIARQRSAPLIEALDLRNPDRPNNDTPEQHGEDGAATIYNINGNGPVGEGSMRESLRRSRMGSGPLPPTFGVIHVLNDGKLN